MSYVDEAKNVLTDLGSAPVFIEALSQDIPNNNFDIYVVRSCREVYDDPVGHGFPPREQLLPLFDAGNFDSFIFYNYLTCRLEHRSIESPSQITNEFASWKELLVWLFQCMLESIDDDVELENLCNIIEYSDGIDILREA